jgi:hypothetical protein
MSEENLKEGTKVVATLNGMITGIIRGIATNEMPVVGHLYIIEITERHGMNWEAYPYSCTVLPRNQFNVA